MAYKKMTPAEAISDLRTFARHRDNCELVVGPAIKCSCGLMRTVDAVTAFLDLVKEEEAKLGGSAENAKSA